MKASIQILLIGIVLFGVGLALIPLDINVKQASYGYTGEHQFTIKEYSEFKKSVIEYTDDPWRTMSYVNMIDSHEPILVSYAGLHVRTGFPYGREHTYEHDGFPADWLKPILMVAGFLLIVAGITALKEID